MTVDWAEFDDWSEKGSSESGQKATADPENSRLTLVNRDKMLIVSNLTSSKACRLDMTTLGHGRPTLPYGTQATTMLCLAWKMEVSIITESSMKVPCMILGQPCFSVFSPLTSTYLIVIQLQITSIKFHSLISINFLFQSSVISYHLSEFTFCDLFHLGFKTKLWLGNEWRDSSIAFSGSNNWPHRYWWKPLHLRWKRQIWSQLSMTSIIRTSDLVYFLTDVRWQRKFKVNYLV